MSVAFSPQGVHLSLDFFCAAQEFFTQASLTLVLNSTTDRNQIKYKIGVRPRFSPTSGTPPTTNAVTTTKLF